jgi:transcriptional regulator
MTSLYVPKQFQQTDPKHLLEVMMRYNFAILFSMVEGAPFATHLPVLASELDGQWIIDAHVARANPHWRALSDGAPALIVFEGPHTYVSPTQYRSSQRVPTWNYLTVHASGPVSVLDDVASKEAILASLIGHHDPDFMVQWQRFEQGMHDSLMAAIVGLRMHVQTLEGKFKLNQHRLADDRDGLAAAYAAADENRREIGQWMARLGLWPEVTPNERSTT